MGLSNTTSRLSTTYPSSATAWKRARSERMRYRSRRKSRMIQSCPLMSGRYNTLQSQSRCPTINPSFCLTRTAVHARQNLPNTLLDTISRRCLSLQLQTIVTIQPTGTSWRITTTSSYHRISTLLCRTTTLISSRAVLTAQYVQESIRSSHTAPAIHKSMPSHSASRGQRLLGFQHLVSLQRLILRLSVFKSQVRTYPRSRHQPQNHPLLLHCVPQYWKSMAASTITRGSFLLQRILQHPEPFVLASAVCQLQVTSCLMMMSLRLFQESTNYAQMEFRTSGPGFKTRSRVARRS